MWHIPIENLDPAAKFISARSKYSERTCKVHVCTRRSNCSIAISRALYF